MIKNKVNAPLTWLKKTFYGTKNLGIKQAEFYDESDPGRAWYINNDWLFLVLNHEKRVYARVRHEMVTTSFVWYSQFYF